MIKIAIAEDNNFLSQSLINKLGLFDDFKVKFQAIHGEELLSKLETNANVDVILMDIQMPNMDGIEATRIITKKYPQIKIIMLTIMDDEQSIYESIKAGAIGYLVKESSPQDLFDGINEIIGGGAPMSPEIARKAIKIIQNPDVITKEFKDFSLTAREKDVLFHLSKGSNYNQIASNLIISPNTVRRHIEKIYKKLDVHNKAEALQVAYNHNLV